MQSLSAIGWLPTAALICGLMLGVLTLSCACLMIIREQRSARTSISLAVLGALLLVISIWQSGSGNIDELKAKIADFEQQHRQLSKEMEEVSGQQQTQSVTLSNIHTKIQTSLTSLQQAVNQYGQQTEALTNEQVQIKQWLTRVQNKTEQQAGQIQELRDGQQHVSASYSNRLTEQGHLLDHMGTQIAQMRADFTAVSEDHAEQLENVAEQRQALATRLDNMATSHQMNLKSLQEDIEAVSSPGQERNLIKAATQHELSSLRREVDQLQENIRQLQGRRYRAHRTP
jgi:chromosome segregation ATPase